MSFTLEGRSVLITGAASGIGAACARLAASRGAGLILCDIDVEAGEALTEALIEQGARCYFQLCNVTSESDVSAAVAAALEHFGRLDAAINNAGTSGIPTALEDTSLEEWQRVLDINLTSVFLCVKHQLRVMKAAGSGAIVNVASGAGLMGTPNLVPYCASKHGVLGVTRTAVAENVASGVRINSVLPGSTRTPMIEQAMAISPEVKKMVMASVPCGRLGEAEEVAEAVLWLCSDAASYMNGHSLVVDGGTLNR